MATVRELVTIWGFDIDDKPLDNLENSLEDVKSGVKAVGAAAIAAGAALFGMAKFTSLTAKELQRTSDNVGVSTQSLQEYRFAAEQVGVESQQLDSVFFNLNKTIGEARQGYGEGRVGIELLARETGQLIDLNGTTEEQFRQISEALLQVEDKAERAAIAEKFFGGEARNIQSLLNSGIGTIDKYRSEFRELGGVMDDELIESSKEFEQIQNEILTIFTGVRNLVAKELMPVMVELGDEFKAFFKENRDFVKSGVSSGIKLLGQLFMDSLNVIKELVEFVMRLSKMFGGLEKVLQTVLTAFIGFKALQIAVGFGNLIRTGFQAIKMFRTMGSAALIAQAKLMAIPLAITAIVAAIALIAEDIITFTQGGDSVFGRMLDGLGTVVETMKEKFSELGDPFKTIISMVLTPVRMIVNSFQSVIKMIDIIRGKTSFLKGISDIGGNIANTFGFGASDSLASAVGMESKPKVSNTRNTNVNNNTNAKLDINLVGLTDQQSREAAQQGVEEGFRNVLRETQRQTDPVVER